MPLTPHSGNKCSGMCPWPCDHPDCWQCAEGRSKKLDKEVVVNLARLGKAAEKVGVKSLLAELSAEKPADWQKATITRGALEALAGKAGVRMDWNNGSPVFYDDDVQAMERRYDKAQQQVLKNKIKDLEQIAARQASGDLTPRVASSLAAAAMKQMDTMANDTIKQKVEETLREDMVANEEKIKQGMRVKGASDEDIAAVEKLLAGGPPDPPEPEPKLSDTELKLGMNVDLSSIVSAQILKKIETTLKENRFSDGTYTAIVHPDAAKGPGWKARLDAKLIPVARALDALRVSEPRCVCQWGPYTRADACPVHPDAL